MKDQMKAKGNDKYRENGMILKVKDWQSEADTCCMDR
jgi:hypothetical protein